MIFRALLITVLLVSGHAYADRLSVSMGDPSPETDIVAGSLYRGSQILSLSTAIAGKNYDVFDVSGNLCMGPAWTNDTTRSSPVEQSGSDIVNTNAISCVNGSTTYSVAVHGGTLVGGFRSHANGQTRSTKQSRLVWSVVPILLPVLAIDTTSSWSYSGAIFRQVNGNPANQIEVFNGLSGRPVNIRASAYMIGSSLTAGFVGIGLDSSTADSSQIKNPCAGSNTFPVLPCWAEYSGYPGIGYHEFRWIERGTGTGATWVGNSGYVGYGYQTGLIGSIVQ